MAINYASKFSDKVSKRFYLKSMTNAIKNSGEYDWAGVSTVTIYDRPTVAMTDYTLTGASRFGSTTELQNTKEDFTVSKDRAFSVSIDKKSEQDTMGVMKASKFLKDQIDEVVTPEIDVYRLSVLATNAGNTSAAEVPSATTAYSILLAGAEKLNEGKVPMNDRVCYVNPSYYSFLKLDNSFIRDSEKGQGMLINGKVGTVDGIDIIMVPASYLPANTNFIIAHKKALITVMKLDTYKIHEDPVDYSGFVIQGRVRYDAFVLTNKKVAIYRSKNA